VGATPGLADRAGRAVPFRIVCPRCGHETDVVDTGYRLTITPSRPPPPAGRVPYTGGIDPDGRVST
jgi:hypothetical protein